MGARRLLFACLILCVAGLVVGASAAVSGEPQASQSSLSDGLSLAGSPLVIGQAQELLGDEQLLAQRRVDLTNPIAVEERKASRTRFEHLGATRAVQVARESFPVVVEHPAGGAPRLPAGEKIVKYEARNAAAITLPDGKHGVIESLGPIATPSGHGQFTPIDLALHSTGNGYAPANSDAAVRIPKHASGGVSMPGDGVSLTPVNAQGQSLAGSEGVQEGASVVYANTQTDTDTLAKPTTGGFEIDSLLRSVESPETLYFKVGMPQGARLVGETDPGGARVVLYGKTIAAIAPVSAQDAAGTPVPVQMSVSGDTLVVAVKHSAGEYQYPIEVDPHAYDETLKLPGTSGSETENNLESDTETAWRYYENPAGKFTHYLSSGAVMATQGAIAEGEHDEFRYGAHGQASITWIETESQASVSEVSAATTRLEFVHGSSVEQTFYLAKAGESYAKRKEEACDQVLGVGECKAAYPENEVRIAQVATKPAAEGYGLFWFQLNSAIVGVRQEKAPEVSFNTTEPTIGNFSGLQNALYGGGGWLGAGSGAVEIIAKDPGLGISNVNIKDLTAGPELKHWEFNDPVYANGLCTGVWCNPTFKTNGANGMYFTFNKEMAEGANTFELCAEDKAGMKSCTDATVNVDATPPTNLKLNGIAETGAELNATQHQATIEASDEMSGIKSLKALVDGREVEGGQGGSCSGKCTASRTLTLDGESLGAGEHKLIVTATDYAGNIAAPKEYTFAIRNATPMKIGPGTVDPVTGQFALGASDVDVAGAGGVSRTYLSRSLTAGAEGPLGPQWSLNAGLGQSLKLLPDGNAELKSAGGGLTTFASDGKGGFKAPPGDENLTLESKEKVAGKGITEYLLKDPTAGTTTVFKQPFGSEATPPVYIGQFGYVGVQLNTPESVAVDPKGNVWVVDVYNDRIVKFSPTGEQLGAYGSYGTEEGTEEGKFYIPWGIAINQSTGNVYVTDQQNARVVELSSSGSFVKAMGWGVSNGKAEYEVCTSGCKAGIVGSGNGQFNTMAGIAVDSSGNLWVADFGNNRIQEFNESGTFLKTFGSEGTAGGQFKGPTNIALSGGNLYVTDYNNARVQELSTSGTFVKAMGWGVTDGKAEYEVCTSSCKAGIAGSGNGQFNLPRGIAAEPGSGNLYVSDMNNSRVQELAPSGSFLAKFGSFGSGNGQFNEPAGVAVSSSGIYVVDRVNDRVQEWSHATWLATRSENTAPGDTRAMTYRSIVVEGQTVTEPIEELGPEPAGVSCGKNPAEVNQSELQARLEELKSGCRALSFTYAEKTTATGEGPSEWGEYNGRLTKVSFTGYNPASSSKKMETTAVAQYSYDKQGRLRAEWDPRIASALKTTYGYDSEGHLTALTQPGQETWALHYGAIEGDANTGRLLSVAHASASTALGNNILPQNTVAPTLSTASPVMGTAVSVSSNGTWSNGPVAFGYQWERCSSAGSECVPIAGAVNQSYTPIMPDEGHDLVAVVTATGSGGSASASTVASKMIAGSAPTYSLQFGAVGSGNGQLSTPLQDAVDPSGNVWVADNRNFRVEEFSPSGAFIAVHGSVGHEEGQFEDPWGIAINQTSGNIYVSDEKKDCVEEFSSSWTFIRQFGSNGSGSGQLSQPTGVAIDSSGNVWVADYGNNRVEEFSETGAYVNKFGSVGSGNGEFKHPVGIAFLGGHVYVTDSLNARVQEFSMAGGWIASFGKSGTGNGEFGEASMIATDPVTGDLYVTDHLNNRVQEFSSAGAYISQFGVKGTGNGQFTGPIGIAVDSSGNTYVVDSSNNRVEKFTPSGSTQEPTQAAPNVGTDSVSTVEYRVPVSGTGAPYQMTNGEMAKWGQKKDLPSEATAIFPPDEPRGWPAPASGYKRATVLYMDEHARTTNTLSPSGAISTVEYNTLNEVTRTLSASDRAIAMKETCESELKCKSAEVAKNLSSEKIYNGEGTQLLETFGPEHEIKLPNGTEEETRDRQKFAYNEGAPSSGEKYNLVTKSSSWAENAAKKELDPHETTTAYSSWAQGELGWTLRKPLVTTETTNGKTVTENTKYSSETGAPVESLTATTTATPVFSLQFGALGSGTGQFKEVFGVAVDPSGYVWAMDKGNHRVEKFTSGGLFVAAYGAEGTIGGDYKEAQGIAVNQSTGNVYVTDSSDNRIEELNSSGAFVEAIGWGVSNGKAELQICKTTCQAGISGSGNGEFNDPIGIAVDATGNLWVADAGNNRVEELSGAIGFITKFGSYGAGNGQFNALHGIAISGGNIYVADKGNARVEELSPTGKYINQFGGKGTGNGQFEGPEGISADPVTGSLYVTDTSNPVQEFTSSGVFVTKFGAKGLSGEQFKNPQGVAVNAAGEIYVADTENSRVQMWQPLPSGPPMYTSQFGSSGSGNGQFQFPTLAAFNSSGNLWVADSSLDRLQEFNEKGTYQAQFGSKGTGAGQFMFPFGVAISAGGNIYVADRENQRIQEFSSSGTFIQMFGYGVSNGEAKLQVCTTSCRAGVKGSGAGQFNEPDGLTFDGNGDLWVADEGNSRIEEFSESGGYINEYGTKGSGEGQINQPVGIAYDDGNLYVTEAGNQRVQEFSTSGAYVNKFGSEGTGNGQFKVPYAIAVGPKTGNLYVTDRGNNRVEVFTPAGKYLTGFGTTGKEASQDELPTGIAVNAGEVAYVSDHTNARVDIWSPVPRPGNEGAENSKTTYYSAAANEEYSNCGGHPEWANLVCQTEPDVQPGDSGPPPLPVTTTTYNMWDEPETVTETIGSVTRTTKTTYDSAGRLTGNEEKSTSSENAALPAVTDEYSTETGAMVKESETLEGKAKTITSAYNTLGRLVSYTDGEGATTKYAYDIDGRIEEISEPMGRQVYAYDTTTGFLTKLLDTAAGTFTATYGVSGEMLTEGYPAGIKATYTYNTIGQATNLEYEKTTHCTEKCVWFSDAEAFGAGGELATQASTLSKETYSYNEEGQLSQTKEESPTGGSCIEERIYGYAESTSERTTLTTRKANEKGECASEGGVVEGHAYDVVGRPLDPGVSYDALGNMTKVPALDAGGQPITSTFYVDNQAATQEQAGKTIAYTYDPAGRTLLAKKGKSLTFSHYAGPGEALTWTCEEEEGKKECEELKATKWTRNIPGIDGALDAIQTNGETPVLQLHDLEGNIIAAVPDSETATGLEKLYDPTEFGVPSGGKAPKYGWFGASGAESELETGVITQAGATYVPQLARTEQTVAAIPPGAAPNGVMATEAYSPPELPWANQSGNEGAANTVAQQKELEREAKEKACFSNPLACEVEDPIIHYTASGAKKKAKEIDEFVAAGDLTKLLGSLFGTLADWVTGYIEAHFVTATIFEWSDEYGEFLTACVRELHAQKDSHGGCRAEYGDILGVVPDFFGKFKISYCLVGTHNVNAYGGLELKECTPLGYEDEERFFTGEV